MAYSKPSAIRQGQPYSAEETSKIVAQFNRDGYYHLAGLLGPEEVEALKDACVRRQNDPELLADLEHEVHDYTRGGNNLMRMFEYDASFRDLIGREPIVGLIEAFLGDDCHLMSQNVLIRDPISPDAAANKREGWHVDDFLHFPVSEHMERHDPRMTMPCQILNCFILLTDVDSVDYGPTQLIPGSHYAGKNPPTGAEITFDGREPASIVAKAGDAYLVHNQVWHRGGPNTSDRTRYLILAGYSKRFISQRFYPFVDYRMPSHVFEGADPRLQRLLGRHEKGPYG